MQMALSGLRNHYCVPWHCPSSLSLSVVVWGSCQPKRVVVVKQQKQVVDRVVGAESREPTKHVKILLIQNDWFNLQLPKCRCRIIMENLLITHSILNRKIRKKYVQKVWFSKFKKSQNWEPSWQPKIRGLNWTEPEPTVQFFWFSVLASVWNRTLASLGQAGVIGRRGSMPCHRFKDLEQI